MITNNKALNNARPYNKENRSLSFRHFPLGFHFVINIERLF